MAKCCDYCGKPGKFEEFFGVKLCDKCRNAFDSLKIDNPKLNESKEYLDRIGTKSATTLAIQDYNKRLEVLKKATVRKNEELRIQATELRNTEYANSFNEFYEYDVVTIINKDHGLVNKNEMMRVLAEHAQKGWKLHTIYSNELGKNAVSVLGFSTNSTACEDVLIFERRIEKNTDR